MKFSVKQSKLKKEWKEQNNEKDKTPSFVDDEKDSSIFRESDLLEDPFPDYPLYPPEDDIYHKYKEEKEINPEYTSRIKRPNEKVGELNEKDFDEDFSGDDLDIPGSELDDEQELTGNEDEENNYYSLGGEDHEDLDEVNDDLL
jgi:hypothetical protein